MKERALAPVRVEYRDLGGRMPGFAFDTPDGCCLVFDHDLSIREQVLIAAELLDDDEFTEVQLASMSA